MTASHHHPKKLPRTAGAGSSGGGEVLKKKKEHYSKAQERQYEWLKKRYPFSHHAGAGDAARKKADERKKKRSAPGTPAGSGWITAGNEVLPDCAAVAVANTLLAASGVRVADSDVIRLHRLAGADTSITGVLEVLAAGGLGGWKPAGFWPCAGELCGLPVITGLGDGVNDHAAARTTGGLISWGAPLSGALLKTWAPDGEYWAIAWPR